MRTLPFLLLLLTGSLLRAQPPAGYYASAEGFRGLALRQALHGIINGHDAADYAALWQHFGTTDLKDDGSIWDIYSDVPGGVPPYVYTFMTDQCGNAPREGACYNREHSFPSSWFGNSTPMRTDLFHIYPTDGYVNNVRGNLAFGRVGTTNYSSQNGSKRGSNTWPGYTGQVFEPIDAYKGDLARSFFYMYTRYWGSTNSWSSPMQQGNDLAPWALQLLLSWHEADPVSAKEVARNNAIYAIQDNRNPYIDRPEWVREVFLSATGVEALWTVDLNVYVSEGQLHISVVPTPGMQARLLDVTGRELRSFPIRSQHNSFTLDVPTGLYLVELLDGDQRTVQRIVH